jgi:integrase
MSIDRLPSGLWRARYPGVKSRSFPRKGEAEDYEDSAKQLKRTGRVDTSDAGLQTLAELAAEHMSAVQSELSVKTLKTYRDLWSAHVDERILANHKRQKCHKLANKPLRAITPKAIEEWRNERLADGAGKQSIRKCMALMQSMFDRATRDEAITSNPVKLIKKPSGKSDNGALVIAPEAVEKIRAELDDTGRMMVALLAQTGMRPGEARALRWGNVGAQSISVECGCNPDGTTKLTKTEQRRTLPLLPTLKADLKAWRKAQGDPSDDAYLFPRTSRRRTKGGGPCWSENDWRNFERRHFKVAVVAAGVKLNRAYELRHSIASLWLAEGVNPLQVAQWLGHKASETFDTYGKVIAELDPKDKLSAAERIAKARRTCHRDVTAKKPRAKPARPRQQKTAHLQAV